MQIKEMYVPSQLSLVSNKYLFFFVPHKNLANVYNIVTNMHILNIDI